MWGWEGEAKGQSIRIIYLAATAAGATGTTATCAARGAGAILELSGAGGSLVGSKTISTFMGRSLRWTESAQCQTKRSDAEKVSRTHCHRRDEHCIA